MSNQVEVANKNTPHSPANSKTKKGSKVCQVCFTNTKRQKPSKELELMTCTGCKAMAHRMCYDSTVQGATFTCDLCRNHKNQAVGKICAFCLNDGLLKEVGAGKFAHPVCCLVYNEAKPVRYETLEFRLEDSIDLTSKPKKICDHCKNLTPYIEGCFHNNCLERCHLYCCLEYQDSLDSKGWESLLRIRKESAEVSRTHHKERKLLRCPSHEVPCICLKNEEKSYIFCDQCLRWYHDSCVDVNALDYGQQKLFFCKFCSEWDKKTTQPEAEFDLRQYPQLHFYDFVKILITYEKTGRQKVMDVIKRFPFRCTANKYINPVVANIEGQIMLLLERMAQEETVDKMLEMDVNPHLIESIVKEYNLNPNPNLNPKQQKPNPGQKKSKKKPSKEHCTAKELSSLINQIPPERRPLQLNSFLQFMAQPQNYETTLFYMVNQIKRHFSTSNKLQTYSRMLDSVQIARRKCPYDSKPFQLKDDLGMFRFINDKDITELKKMSYIQAFKIVLEMAELWEKSSAERGVDYTYFMTNIFHKCYRLNTHSLDIVVPFYEKFMADAVDDDRLGKKECTILDGLLNTIEEIEIHQYSSLRDRLIPVWNSDRSEELDIEFLTIARTVLDYDEIVKEPPESHAVERLKEFLQMVSSTYTVKLPLDRLKVYGKYILHHDSLRGIVDLIVLKYNTEGIPYQRQRLSYSESLLFLDNYVQAVRTADTSEGLLVDITDYLEALSGVDIPSHLRDSLETIYTLYLNGLDPEGVTCKKMNKILKIVGRFDLNYMWRQAMAEKDSQYQKWCLLYQELFRGDGLIETLEDMQRIESFKARIKEAQGALIQGRLNAPEEEKAIKAVEIWCLISYKLNTKILKFRPTPGAVKEMYDIALKSHYPQHMLCFRKLQNLYQHIRDMEKFTGRIKVSKKSQREEIEVFRELAVVEGKTKVSEMGNIISKLNKSPIDYTFDVGDLTVEMDLFNKKSADAEDTKTLNFEELSKLFRYFLYDCPFVYESFALLRNKLRALQCKSIPKTKKEFDRLMMWGGKEAMELSESCKDNVEAYSKLTIVEDALVRNREKDYLSFREMDMLRAKLFENDIKKHEVKKWMEEFQRLEGLVEDFSSKTNHKKCTIGVISGWIEAFERIPIKSEKLKTLKQNRDFVLRADSILRQLPVEEWLNSRVPLEETAISVMLGALSRLYEEKISVPEHLWLIKLLEKYSRLVRDEVHSCEDYLEFLEVCNRVGPKFQTPRLEEIRINNFAMKRDGIELCANRREAQVYVTESVFLNTLNSELVPISVVNHLIQVMESKPEILQSHDSSAVKRERPDQGLQLLDEESEEFQDAIDSDEVEVVDHVRGNLDNEIVIDSEDE